MVLFRCHMSKTQYFQRNFIMEHICRRHHFHQAIDITTYFFYHFSYRRYLFRLQENGLWSGKDADARYEPCIRYVASKTTCIKTFWQEIFENRMLAVRLRIYRLINVIIKKFQATESFESGRQRELVRAWLIQPIFLFLLQNCDQLYSTFAKHIGISIRFKWIILWTSVVSWEPQQPFLARSCSSYI